MAGKWETLNEVKDVRHDVDAFLIAWTEQDPQAMGAIHSEAVQNGEELDVSKHRQMFRRGWVDMGATSDGWTDIASQPKMSPRPLKKAGVSKPFFRFRRPSDEAINTAALFTSY